MATFTVHVPPGIADAAVRADRTIFVRDGFSVPALVLGPAYLLYRRLWRATLVWIVAAILLAVLVHALDLPLLSRVIVGFVLGVLTGLEAREARRRALGRRGYVAAALLAGVTRDAAERIFFAAETPFRLPEKPSAPRPPATPTPTGRPAVIGLFPLPDRGLASSLPDARP